MSMCSMSVLMHMHVHTVLNLALSNCCVIDTDAVVTAVKSKTELLCHAFVL